MTAQRQKSNHRFRARTRRGAISIVMMAFLLFLIFTISALALDSAHAVMVKEQLQTACDAAAMAGSNQLMGDPVSIAMSTNATTNAISVAAANSADQIPISSTSPDTTVVVTVDSVNVPHTVTVQATRMVHTVFAKLLGCPAIPVSASAQSGAWHGMKALAPNQAFNLAISMDAVPTKGPEAGIALRNMVGPGAVGQTFTASLNPQNQCNAGWISQWNGTSSEELDFGITPVTLNGVEATNVQGIVPGQVLVIPLVVGNINQSNTYVVVGIIGFKVTSVSFPQSITCTLCTPGNLRGVPGMPVNSLTDSLDNAFLAQWFPWRTSITL